MSTKYWQPVSLSTRDLENVNFSTFVQLIQLTGINQTRKLALVHFLLSISYINQELNNYTHTAHKTARFKDLQRFLILINIEKVKCILIRFHRPCYNVRWYSRKVNKFCEKKNWGWNWDGDTRAGSDANWYSWEQWSLEVYTIWGAPLTAAAYTHAVCISDDTTRLEPAAESNSGRRRGGVSLR